jgi:hypothetical protein
MKTQSTLIFQKVINYDSLIKRFDINGRKFNICRKTQIIYKKLDEENARLTIFIDNTFVDFSKTAKSKQICFDYQESDDILEKRMSMEAKETTKIIILSSRAKIKFYYSDGKRQNFSGMEN